MAFGMKELSFSISLTAQEDGGPKREMNWVCAGPTCTATVTEIKIMGDKLAERDNVRALRDALIAMLASVEDSPRP